MNADEQKLFPGSYFISNVIDAAEVKAQMSRRIVTVYLMRAAMAGFLIGVFYLANYAVISAFSAIDPALTGVGKFVGAIVFGFALVFIYFSKSELLTSNMMITTIAVYFKRMRVRRAALIMTLSWCGNFLGGVLVALLVKGSSVLDGATGEAVMHSIDTKLGYLDSASGVMDLLVRAIFCNFLINIAMLLVYNGFVKSEGVKVVAMNVAVMLFAFLGFEHSVANTVFFTTVGIGNGIAVWPAIGNVCIALIGNFIGGGLLIGWYYAFINDPMRHLGNESSICAPASESMEG